MSEEAIKDIFIAIAFRAMDSGKEIKLEKGKNTSTSSVLGGAISQNDSNYDSLTLNVFMPEKTEEVVEEDEEE